MLKVSNGMGVDSWAMLVGLKQRGIIPDYILNANPGAEYPWTYTNLDIYNDWLESWGAPRVVIVKYEPTRATYNTLEEKCLTNETLPSLAFGRKSCSIVFKKEPQEKWMRQQAAVQAIWSIGEKVECAIGYDAGPKDSRRSKIPDDDYYTYRYFLREWGWDREECMRQIAAEGIPMPRKTACWFCPANKQAEVMELRDKHPELFARGLAMEDNARNGKHGLQTVKGLGRSWSWHDLKV
jgi:hypothetical protein